MDAEEWREPRVYECSRCGRLWVDVNFTDDERRILGNSAHHVARECVLPDGNYAKELKVCCGYIYPTHRPALQAAFLLGGKLAAENMADGALAKHINEFEQEQLRDLLHGRRK